VNTCKTCNGRGKVQAGYAGEELADCPDCGDNRPEQRAERLAAAENAAKISEREARIRDYLKTTQDDPFYTGDLTYLLVILDAERLRITQLKTQLQELIASVKGLPQNWRSAAEAQNRVAEKHADIYGTGNETYVEAKERWRALRDCAEHLEAVLE
jgi:uncharacterized Zn finger protein